MKRTSPREPNHSAQIAHQEQLTSRERILLMMTAQLLVLTCIVLAASVGGLSWQWTLLLAIAPIIGGALLSRVWGKLPR